MENTTLVDERNINKFNLGKPYHIETEVDYIHEKAHIGNLIIQFNNGYRLELKLTKEYRDEIVKELKKL